MKTSAFRTGSEEGSKPLGGSMATMEKAVRHDWAPYRAGRPSPHRIAAAFHADRFGHGDLHMVDAVAVPDRLEHAIGKAQRHDVLDRFFAEEVVDPENLVLR